MTNKSRGSISLWENKYFIVVLGLLVAICMQYCINSDELGLAYTNSLFSFAAWACYVGFLFHIKRQQLWSSMASFVKCSVILMMFLAAVLVAGVQLDIQGRVDFTAGHLYLAIVILGIGWTPICAWIMYRLGEMENHCLQAMAAGVVKRRGLFSERNYFWGVWLLLFLAYIPTLLATWPGFFTYDAEAETYMVFTDKYSTYQPLTHVVLLGWILRILYRFTQSYNVGITVYLLLQMLVVSGCFAYMMNFLKQCGVRRSIRNIGIAFLALFPTVSMFVCCTTKDVYFSGGIVLFTTLLLEYARDRELFWKSKSKKFVFLLASLLILLFRNNGVYAYVLFTLICLLVYRKDWRRWLLTLGTALLSFALISGALCLIFNAKKGPIAELFCVPMQQLARVHEEAEESFDAQDKEIMYNLIPESILENYNPKLADRVKINFLEDNFKANPGPFISLWIEKGLEHPDIYINSFLMNTYGYWYPDTVLDGYTGIYTGGRQYGESSYFAFVTENPGARNSLLPWLERFYERVSLEIYQQKVPVISMLFSIGFWFWVYLFTIVCLWKRNYRKQVISFSMIGFVFLTVLLGPIALVRYVLYLFFCAPLILALLFDGKALAGENIH